MDAIGTIPFYKKNRPSLHFFLLRLLNRAYPVSGQLIADAHKIESLKTAHQA